MRRRSRRSDRRSLESRLAALDARIFGRQGTPRFDRSPRSGGSRILRILGSTGSRRRRRYQLAAIFSATALLALLAALPAQAIHQLPDTSLELDRNVADNPAGAPDDWNNFFPAAPGDVTFTTGIVSDPEPQTIFTGAQSGGSSKDNQDISGWRWKCGSVPPKDEIADAASAIYNISPTEQRLYFMADREAVNGSSHVGVWFFKKSVTTAGACDGAQVFSDGVAVPPTHSVGDILVLSDFTQGGAVSNIKVFKWVGVGGTEPKSNGTLTRIGLGTDCSVATHNPGDPELCATVNSTLLGPGNGADGIAGTNDDGPTWPYTPASGANGSMPPGSFFEGGIDLGSLSLSGQCFGAVLTETRSSAEIDAVLKDFVVHAFEPCTSGIRTNASASTHVGGTISDTATVTGAGAGAPTGTVTFTVCGPFATPTACTTGDATAQPAGVRTLNGIDNPAVVTSDLILVNTAGIYCFLGHYSGGGGYQPADDNDITRECVEVTTVPTTTTTRQFVYPQDKAQITASAGGNLAGSVRFRLYDTLPNCTADGGTAATGLLYEELGTVHPISGTSPQFATTDNTTAAITSDTTVYWNVSYDSTNPAQDDSGSACTESTQVTYAGNDGTISVP
jgi:hypothetical protein